MWPYWLVFSLVAWAALKDVRSASVSIEFPDRKKRLLGFGWFVLITLAVGFRVEVGGDWETYLEFLQEAADQGLAEVMGHSDPAYHLLNWIAANYGGGIYFVNTICAALFAWGLIAFCNIQPRPLLSLLAAVPYLIIMVAMGYTRQSVAIGLVMLGVVELFQKRVFLFLVWVAFAALFHKSAVLMAPLAIFGIKTFRWPVLVGIILATLVLYLVLLQEAIDGLRANYIEAEYQSTGAELRIGMNALPAVVFLVWRKRFNMPKVQERFWFWMSIFAVLFVGVLMYSPSSTAVDRATLYWIPLQLMVWSYLPDVLGFIEQSEILWTYLVAAYCASVLFVWLFFSNHSFLWLPYKFYPWEVFWS